MDWETIQFADESLPRSLIEYQGFKCICEPDAKHKGKYGFVVYSGEGDWQNEGHRLILLEEYWIDPLFKGIDTLAEAQEKCIDTVNRYKAGEIKPTIIEQGRSSVKTETVSGAPIRSMNSRKRKS